MATHSGTATITYTDGTTQTVTLAFSDWTLGGGRLAPTAGNTSPSQLRTATRQAGRKLCRPMSSTRRSPYSQARPSRV